ncbi:MAG: hypothetical protein ACI971_002683, partial [Colwellia sp.]
FLSDFMNVCDLLIELFISLIKRSTSYSINLYSILSSPIARALRTCFK